MAEAPSVPLILASGSKARAVMLRSAGLVFDVFAADVDEAALYREAMAQNGDLSPPAVANLLASAKAVEVSRRYPEALVIGGDQVLALGSEVIFKAHNSDGARQVLMRLKGQTHVLHSAAAIAMRGSVDWVACDAARLTMRDFSDSFLDAYLIEAGDALTTSVGAYQIEKAGVNLFEAISGSHFTILGLPLVQLLAELRRRWVLIA